MSWEVLVSEEFVQWWDGLAEQEQDALTARIAMLRDHGPSLGRPTVDTIQASRLANLKELRASVGRAQLRVLLVLDAERRALLLVGGNKAGQWQSWYRRAIPEAERIYAAHVETMKRSKR